MTDRDYHVNYSDGRWRVVAPNGKSRTYSTQQAAIDAAKLAAVEERADVIWTDREGAPQGHARFRLPQRSPRFRFRTVITR